MDPQTELRWLRELVTALEERLRVLEDAVSARAEAHYLLAMTQSGGAYPASGQVFFQHGRYRLEGIEAEGASPVLTPIGESFYADVLASAAPSVGSIDVPILVPYRYAVRGTGTPGPCAAPTLNTLSNLTYCGDPGAVTVSLSGITDGMGGSATPIVVTATSSSTVNVPTPTVTYTSPNTTGSIQFTPKTGLNNCATPVTISVKVANGCNTGTRGGTNSVVKTFTVVVVQPTAPTLNTPGNVGPIGHGSANQTVSLSGIGPGTCETAFGSSVTGCTLSGSSSAPTVAAIVSFGTISGAGASSVVVSIGVAGTATISVTVTDPNGSRCGWTNTVTRTFTVTVV